MRKLHIITASVVLAACGLSSCNEYVDDIQGIGQRVVVLEDSVLQVSSTVEALQKLEAAIRSHGVVKNIISNRDGSTTLEFTDGRDPITFVIGTNGKPADLFLSVAEDTDGHYYWTFNGEWITDAEGNKVSAEPVDGKDGKDGKDGQDGKDGRDGADGKNGKDGKDGKDGQDAAPAEGDIVLPQVRINPTTRIWEISIDGGNTWESTGVKADGEDGKDGKDGRDGKDGADGKDGQDGKDGRDGKDGEDGAHDPVIVSISYTDQLVIFTIYVDGKYQTVFIPRVED